MDFMKEGIGEYIYTGADRLFKEMEREYDKEKIRNFKEKYISVDCNNVTYKLSDFLISLMNDIEGEHS